MTTPPVFARGVSKTVTISAESVFGTPASGPGQLLRRVSFDLNPIAQPIESQEINPAAQVRDMRLGPRQIQGTLSGQLSPASYSMIWQALLRGVFTTGTNITGITDSVAVIDGTTGNLKITSATASFVSDAGFKIGDVCRLTSLTGGATADLGENLRLVNCTETLMEFAPPTGGSVVWSSAETLDIHLYGKKLIIPSTVHTQTFYSFSIEQWYDDIQQSELFTGCRFSQASINIPAAGFVTFQASLIGRDMTTGTEEFYSSPTAVTTTTALTAAGGRVTYNGADVAIITGMNIQISVDTQADPVVGSQLIPAIFLGNIAVRGSFSCLMLGGDSLTSDYLNEQEVTITVLLTTKPDGTAADFMSIVLPRVKLASATRTDSSRAITRNYNFVALEMDMGGVNTPYDDTSISIQDSLTD